MNLKILLPYKVFSETGNVKKITVETSDGSYGLLPHRLDFAAALVPGILSYEASADGLQYVAVDEGVIVKAGADVIVSVRNAIGGTNLGKLHTSVDKEFANRGKTEKNVRSVMAKMEAGLMQNLIKLHED